MEEVLYEFVPGIVGSFFFLSLIFLIIHIWKWFRTIQRFGWWNSDSYRLTRKICIWGFASAAPFSIMVLAAPQSDADAFWVMLMWTAFGLLVALERIQKSGIAYQEGIA